MAITYYGSVTANFAGNWATYGGAAPNIDRNVSTRSAPFTVPVSGGTVLTLERGMACYSSYAGATVKIGIYDASDDSLIHEATINVRSDDDPAEYVWHPVSVNIPLEAGMVVYLASGRPSTEIYHTQGTDNWEIAEPSTTNLPATWVTDSTSGRQIPLRMSVDDEPAYTVDTVTTGGVSGLKVGSAFAITTTGMGTVNSIAIESVGNDDAVTNAVSVSAVGGDGTAQVKFYEDGEHMPFAGPVSLLATGDDGAASKTLTLSIPDGYSSVTFSGSVITDDPTHVGYHLALLGKSILEDDIGIYEDENDLVISSAGAIECENPFAFPLYLQRAADGIIEQYNITILEDGVSPGGDPAPKIISARTIGAQKITATVITATTI